MSYIEDFIQRGYRLCVRWRAYEERYHAYVDLGTAATSHNFMGTSVKEALEGLDRYLESHAHSGEVNG